MSFLGNFVVAVRFAKELMLKYNEATRERATVKEAAYYAFLILLVPASISVVLSVSFHVSSSIYFSSDPIETLTGPYTQYGGPYDTISRLSPESDIRLPMLVVLAIRFVSDVTIPIAVLLALAGIMHAVGRMLRLIGGRYNATFAALVYGATPGIMISWAATPLMWVFGGVGGWIVSAATFIWGVTVGVTALENQHGIGPGRALVVYFLPVIMIVLVVAASSVYVTGYTSSQAGAQFSGQGTEEFESDSHLFEGIEDCAAVRINVDSVDDGRVTFSNPTGAVITNTVLVDDFGGSTNGTAELAPGETSSIDVTSVVGDSVTVRGLCNGRFVVEGACREGQVCWDVDGVSEPDVAVGSVLSASDSIYCSYANVLIDSCSYDSESGVMSLGISNIGNVDLDLSVDVDYPDHMSSTEVGQLASGEDGSYSVDGVGDGFDQVTVSTQCPQVFDYSDCR